MTTEIFSRGEKERDGYSESVALLESVALSISKEIGLDEEKSEALFKALQSRCVRFNLQNGYHVASSEKTPLEWATSVLKQYTRAIASLSKIYEQDGEYGIMIYMLTDRKIWSEE